MQHIIPIIVLNWNGIEDTQKCINLLLQQTYTNYHIYLVDNGSDSGNIKKLNELFSKNQQITLIFNTENLGFVGAHNQLIEQENLLQKHPYIALLNNDAFPDKNWLNALVSSAEKEGLDMVSSKIINNQRKHLIDNTGHFMLNTGEVMPWGFGEHIELHNRSRKNAGACAGAALYSSKMLLKIGLFDSFFKTGYEDAELGIRALITGHKLRYEPKAIVFHQMSASINKVRNEAYMVYMQEAIYYTYFKLMPLPVILFNIGFLVFRTLLLLLLFTLFMRPTYVKIWYKSLKKLLGTDWSSLTTARKSFLKENELISTLQIINTQRFFLWDNIKRFYVYFIKGTPTIFEKHLQ